MRIIAAHDVKRNVLIGHVLLFQLPRIWHSAHFVRLNLNNEIISTNTSLDGCTAATDQWDELDTIGRIVDSVNFCTATLNSSGCYFTVAAIA